jgi:membrane fusion protein (multidrug efflux system)
MGQTNQREEPGQEEEKGRESSRPDSFHARGNVPDTPKCREEKDSKDSKDQPVSDKEDGKNQNEKKPPAYKRPVVILPIAGVLAIGLVAAILYWLHARHFESTDDAYIDGHVTQISAQVPAQVLALHIQDNQFVHKGDLLVELDPTDYQVALDQAKARESSAAGKLEQSRAQVGSANAAVTQATAEVEAAKVTLENATRDLDRYQAVDERARSRQQLDNAIAAQRTAQAQFEQAKARTISAEANVATAAASVKAAEGDLKTAQSEVRRAEVSLSYCRIFSPRDGRVTQRTLEAGNYTETGQAMFMLVSPDVWVTANFKETQLKLMRTNQPVTIRIDAYPGKEFSGHVDSIQAGSGSRFSILPAENATGNFVKVVQRVPVKIVFDHPQEQGAQGLGVGLSVIPRVRVR